MPLVTKRAAIAVFILFAFTTRSARANGRFPEAQLIESVPGDPNTLFLRATFGILISRDKGLSWRYICERALGYEGQWDPPVAATRDGRLWVGLEDGLVSTRDGCSVEASPELDGNTVKDLTTDPRGEVLWAITGAPGKRSFVWRHSGKWQRLAGMDDTNFMTVEVAPSQPSRVYVSGQPYSTIRGQIFRSDDGGATLSGAKNDLAADGPLFIGAVDPKDPNRLLIRHLHAKGSDLLLSRDAGKTFANVLSITSAMFGFAKSADGTTYWAGSGLADHGLFRSTDRGVHFAATAKEGVLCLHYASEGALYACANALTTGAPAISVSRDGGKSLVPLARFADVRGPVECGDSGARASLCAGSWQDMKTLLEPRDAGAKETSTAPEPPRRARSCSCELVGAPSTDLRLLTLLALAITGGWRRLCTTSWHAWFGRRRRRAADRRLRR